MAKGTHPKIAVIDNNKIGNGAGNLYISFNEEILTAWLGNKYLKINLENWRVCLEEHYEEGHILLRPTFCPQELGNKKSLFGLCIKDTRAIGAGKDRKLKESDSMVYNIIGNVIYSQDFNLFYSHLPKRSWRINENSWEVIERGPLKILKLALPTNFFVGAIAKKRAPQNIRAFLEKLNKPEQSLASSTAEPIEPILPSIEECLDIDEYKEELLKAGVDLTSYHGLKRAVNTYNMAIQALQRRYNATAIPIIFDGAEDEKPEICGIQLEIGLLDE